MKPLRSVTTRQTPGHTAGVSRRRATVSHLLYATFLCLVANCSSASMAPGRSAPAAAERVVMPGDFGSTVTVRRGDLLVVRTPMRAAEWQVAYDTSFLEFQGTDDTLAHPDTNGWTFHVVRAGETSLTVTPVMRGGPNPPRFTVSLHIDA
jgi:hypothetical protein